MSQTLRLLYFHLDLDFPDQETKIVVVTKLHDGKCRLRCCVRATVVVVGEGMSGNESVCCPGAVGHQSQHGLAPQAEVKRKEAR